MQTTVKIFILSKTYLEQQQLCQHSIGTKYYKVFKNKNNKKLYKIRLWLTRAILYISREYKNSFYYCVLTLISDSDNYNIMDVNNKTI